MNEQSPDDELPEASLPDASLCDDEQRYVVVPFDALSAAALESLLEEYVTREGTDYGERVYSLAEKREHVRRLLERREVVIVFEPESETCTLRRRDELPG
jgi:uncharacterized protein YheU (UPF0270 family)